MQIENLRSYIQGNTMLASLRPSSDNISCEDLEKDTKIPQQINQSKNKKKLNKLSDLHKKYIELGLEHNDDSSITPHSPKCDEMVSTDISEGESISGNISKSNCTSTSSSSSSGSYSDTSSSSSLDDDSDELGEAEQDSKDDDAKSNETESNQDEDISSKNVTKILLTDKEKDVNVPTIENQIKQPQWNENSSVSDKNTNLATVKLLSLNDKYIMKNTLLSSTPNKSIKRKRDNTDSNIISSPRDSQPENIISKKIYLSPKSLKLDPINSDTAKSLNNSPQMLQKAKHIENGNEVLFNPKILKNSTKQLNAKIKLKSIQSCNSDTIEYSNESPGKSLKENKSKGKTKIPDQPNLLEEVAAAFTEQLSNLNLEQLTPYQISQLNVGVEKYNHNSSELAKNSDILLSNNYRNDSTSIASPECETPNRLSVDTDDMLPIQAEVVMSDGSENENYENVDEIVEHTDSETRVKKEVEAYVHSFANCSTKGSLVEYPPQNNEIPKDNCNLTTWQLEKVALPPFAPSIPPPPWLRFTIPAEGYKCHPCGDTFFIESSLIQHTERRSIWISLECGPCDAKLTFYNKCSFRDHIYQHISKGEHVDEETVVVRSLPLQLTKLLQPIIVPVPQSLRKEAPGLKQSRKGSSPSGGYYCAKERHTSPRVEPMREEQNRTSPRTNGVLETGSMESPLKRIVKCYLCERMFTNVRELMSHMRTNQSSSDQRVECRKCLLVLPSVCAAKAHILTHPPSNSCNISVCPECGSRCDGPRDFVHHLNTCGHQYRRSGILCAQCLVCFFKLTDDFVNHWIKEHCSKSYECVVCGSIFESLVFHKCSSTGQRVLATFKCLLTCPLCPYAVQLHTQEERETQEKIRVHLSEVHPSIVNRVHYVYKSKFCTNAFRSKDELRAHHDREHRRDNHYRTKTCTLHHEVLGYQHQYFNGQDPRNAFVTMPVALSPEEIQEAKTRDVPTVSSVIDKTLFPDALVNLEAVRGGGGLPARRSLDLKEAPEKNHQLPLSETSPNKREGSSNADESIRPCVCYRCGYTYTGAKDFRRHRRLCEGETAVRLCQVCGVSAVGEEFSKHCITHIREGLIICMYCNAAPFPTQTALQQHFMLHVHEQFTYPALCAFCSFPMPDVSMALVHLHEEHDPHMSPSTLESLEVACERCGRKFHGERGLNVHLTRCTAGMTPVVTSLPTPGTGRHCQVCKKALAQEMFGKHIICHLEEGLLVCSLCDGLTLPSSMALLHHLEEHASTLQYPSLCPMCSFTMCSPVEALTHLKEDHGFGNLSCPNCEMHYTFTYQLQRHIDIVHKVCLYAKRRYICWICRAYDHVKKETLMNHFRTVHGLSMEEVDEKVMIRTRGQGTMPTSQFIPTKPLGSKELGGSKADTKGDGVKEDNPKSKGAKNVWSVQLPPDSAPWVKTKAQDEVSDEIPEPTKTKDDEQMEIKLENIVIKKELLDVINKVSDNEEASPPLIDVKKRSPSPQPLFPEVVQETLTLPTLPVSPTTSMKDTEEENKTETKKLVCKSTPNKRTGNRDRKLREKTKVMIKRLPDTIMTRRTHLRKGRDRENLVFKAQKARCAARRQSKRNEKTFCCALCSYRTNSRGKFNHHNEKHGAKDEQDGFVCSECGQSFVVEPSLKRHLFFAHKIKQKPQIQSQATATKNSHNLSQTAKKPFTSSQTKVRLPAKTFLPSPSSGNSRDRKLTLLIKKGSSKPASVRVGAKTVTEKDSELQCCVCRDVFESSIKLYSHLRTHGMAFLKIGRKKRNFIQDKSSATF